MASPAGAKGPPVPPFPLEAANFLYRHALGPIYGWFSRKGLQRLVLPRPPAPPASIPLLHSAANDGRGRRLAALLEAYFAGQREDFADISLDLSPGSAFQQEVWMAARQVPWGKTATYGELALAIGRPAGAARAVGRALGANPIAIVVPCHRFVAANGALTGYAAGLEWKEILLRLESAIL